MNLVQTHGGEYLHWRTTPAAALLQTACMSKEAKDPEAAWGGDAGKASLS